MLTQVLKFFSVNTEPLDLPEIPAVKTVDSVIAVFNQVLDDLKEVQEKAVENIAEATIAIAELQKDIAENAKESERAKSIMDKIGGLLS